MEEFNCLGNKLKLLLFIGLALAIISCSSENSGSVESNESGGSQPIVAESNAIIIDNAGVVPILGESTTTSKIYVHNNSNTNIAGILYAIRDNSQSSSSSLDYESCRYIAARGSCALKFTTPTLSFLEAQGSMIITANYTTQDGINSKFERIIDYIHIDSSIESGVIFSSGAQIFGESNTTHYTTLYMYGSSANQTYKILGMNSDNPEVKITQGDITGQQIHSNEIQVLEIKTPTEESYFSATIVAYSQNISTLNEYSNNATLVMTPSVNKAILTAGIVPLIYSEIESPIGQLFIVNNGNESANISYIEYPIGITEIIQSDSCTIAKSLNPHTSCSIHFNVPQNTNGDGDINVGYYELHNESMPFRLTQSIQWFNLESVVLHMNASPNPLIFNVTSEGKATITINNVGDYDLTNVKLLKPDVTEGNAYAEVIESSLNCTIGESLPVGGSCTYKISVTNNFSEDGIIKLGISGDYYNHGLLESYSDTYNLHYTSYGESGLISMNITPNPVYFTARSNKTIKITVFNNDKHDLNSVMVTPPVVHGNAVVTINGYHLDCSAGGTNLPIGESCTYYASVTSDTIENGIIELGISAYYNNESFTQYESLDYTTTGGSTVYVANSISKDISQFTIDEDTGMLNIITGNVAIPDPFYPVGMVVHPNGKFLYVNHNESIPDIYLGYTSVYSISQNTGIIDFIDITGGWITNSISSHGMALHPNGQYLYLTIWTNQVAGDNDIGIFSIDQTTGLLTHVGLGRAGKRPNKIVVSKGVNEYYAYVTDIDDNTVTMLPISQNGNALGEPSYYGTGSNPQGLAISPNGGFLYVANANSNNISVYQINQTDGGLTGPYFVDTGGINPTEIAIESTNSFAYVTNSGSNNISIFTINKTDGLLTLNSLVPTGSSPTSLAIYPTGNYLYATNSNSNDVSMYKIESTGALESIGSASVIGYQPIAIVIH